MDLFVRNKSLQLFMLLSEELDINNINTASHFSILYDTVVGT